MIKSLLPFCILISLIFVGCKENTSSISNEQKIIVPLDSLSKEKIKLNLLKLSPEAQENLASFEDFDHLKNLMQSMHTSNPFYIRRYADSIYLLVQNFNENISGELKVNTISSRMVLLETETGLLLELSEKENPNAQKLVDANVRLLTAYNSLIIQLNELSLAIPDDIENELLKEQEFFRDSIVDPATEK